jgi:hypothetical protein
MLRIVLNAAILPLELISVGVSSSEVTAGTWCLVAGTVLTNCPAALHWARRLFGDDSDGIERSRSA